MLNTTLILILIGIIVFLLPPTAPGLETISER